ncbi:bleomycin resistance family protein [Pedobacter chinensis]|uniref:Bleomycin resistance family protein n=1 Tax=Pedobacter chinensis TaxID=2282421 RepID=A0A369Q557_9SPHI|nr:VOC family protein [Pedobacter chinensis]RDC58216.1 bleomycin resistance family protein [Pedobacter chinensis]
MKLRKLTPILWTKNLQETITFYVDILGFTCRYQVDRFAALKRDDIEIMTVIPVDEPEDCKAPENNEDFFPKPHFTGSIYIDTENVDELWEQIKDKVTVKYEIGNQEWLVRDFSIWDNNGYEIVFGQDISKEAKQQTGF